MPNISDAKSILEVVLGRVQLVSKGSIDESIVISHNIDNIGSFTLPIRVALSLANSSVDQLSNLKHEQLENQKHYDPSWLYNVPNWFFFYIDHCFLVINPKIESSVNTIKSFLIIIIIVKVDIGLLKILRLIL